VNLTVFRHLRQAFQHLARIHAMGGIQQNIAGARKQ
jgi:hypothetical protein